MTWYTLSASHPQATTITHQIQTAAMRSPLLAQPGFGVFTTRDRHITHWFFSPDAAQLAQMLGAMPCPKPDPAGIAFSVGNDEAREMHFPSIW